MKFHHKNPAPKLVQPAKTQLQQLGSIRLPGKYMDASKQERSQKVKYHQWLHGRRTLDLVGCGCADLNPQRAGTSILWRA
jgi:hypothetical protein